MAFNKQINPYLVGNRVYGASRPHPTSGPVDKMGYRVRDKKHAARRQAILNRMKARAQGRYMSANAMREV